MALRILIVEDEAAVALHLEGMLEEAGHEVTGIAATMNEALRRAADTPRPNLAIMDVDLAGGPDGVEAARRLREGYGVASLFVSAKLSERVRTRALQWHPVGFIGKPFQEEAILKALEAFDNRPAAQPR